MLISALIDLLWDVTWRMQIISVCVVRERWTEKPRQAGFTFRVLLVSTFQENEPSWNLADE